MVIQNRNAHSSDADDFDLPLIELEEFADIPQSEDVSESVNLSGQNWQLSGEAIPRNPNSMATSVEQKLADLGASSRAHSFRFAEDCPNERSESDTPTVAAKSGQTVVSWGDLGLSRPVLKSISETLKFPNPTQIQVDVIPSAISGKDILAAAATGSGKTAAFSLPIVERLLMSSNVSIRRKEKESGRISGGRAVTRAVILLPTRELAVQCWSMFKALTTFVPITSVLVVGGFDSRTQLSDLGKCPDVVIATPGRLLDHLLNSQGVHLESVDMVVLDEADRLLELGFNQAITEIMKCIPKKRLNLKRDKAGGSKGPCQTLMFSATLGKSVETLGSFVLNDAFKVRIAESGQVVSTLTQEFIKLPREESREAAFFSLIESSIQTSDSEKRLKGRVIVFFREKKEAHRVAILAQAFGLGVTELNGDLNQVERLAAISDFQSGKKRYMFATDIAARGLDLPEVGIVVNFSLPQAADAETRYIHRVGRTARAQRSGRSITFFTSEEYTLVKRIVKKSVDKKDREHVLERKLDMAFVGMWMDRIRGIEPILRDIEKEEKVEKEIFVSSQKLTKAENLHKHKKTIENRPRKRWIANERAL
jgi:ATP-dependent RNA helicase DDX27